jgi:hypothetical protein
MERPSERLASFCSWASARDAYKGRVYNPPVPASTDEEKTRIYQRRILELEANLQHLDFDIIEFGLILRGDNDMIGGTEMLKISEVIDEIRDDFPIEEVETQVILRSILNLMRLPSGQIGPAVLSYVDSLYENEDNARTCLSSDEEED